MLSTYNNKKKPSFTHILLNYYKQPSAHVYSTFDKINLHEFPSIQNPFVHQEILMPKPIAQKLPNTTHQIIHMQGHQVGASENASHVSVHEVWSGESPFRRCNSYEEIWECTQPYFIS